MEFAFPQHIHPRKPMSRSQRKKLEKQFAEQVPEYSDYFVKKASFEKQANIVSLGVAAMTTIPAIRHRNRLAAIAVAALTYTTLRALLYSPGGRTLFGLTKFNEVECHRAFNIWVYYTQERASEIEKKEHEREDEFRSGLEQFRAQYSRSDYDPKSE